LAIIIMACTSLEMWSLGGARFLLSYDRSKHMKLRLKLRTCSIVHALHHLKSKNMC
jgi:hypothetical protein